jgi:hypothetical protein
LVKVSLVEFTEAIFLMARYGSVLINIESFVGFCGIFCWCYLI